jgi:carbamoyltransferase
MSHILGTSAFYHDSAACLIREGDIIAAAQEEPLVIGENE